jgi:photosystem II stability/assembly factor-like uncharacterized protein
MSNGTQQIIGRSFVIDASGGYSIQQSFPEIPVATEFFVQNALQIRIGVDNLNRKLGITKDPENENVLEFNHDTENNKYSTDTISIDAAELLRLVKTDNIISMGSLSTLYSDFNYTVLEYFGAPYGFSSLFSGEEHYNINDGVFDASALVHIINGGTFNFAGSYVSDLSGTITIQNLTEVINNVCSRNPFNNRPIEKERTYADGFIANDLIYATDGISITLSVDIEAEPYTPIYNVGPANLTEVNNIYHTLNYTDDLTLVKKRTTATVLNITQVYTVPILIVVSNISDFELQEFGSVWVDATPDENLDYINWLSCAVSSSGKYQTAVEEFGDIYLSTDFGSTWTSTYNMGNAETNCISMSQSGEYQTASNGLNIIVSTDYGQTWTEKQSVGNTQIFVCISLSGKYQLVLSVGDTMYRSTDFGNSWIRYSNEDSDIFNSIMSFPSAGVCMSYDGRYQTIVSENIYRSNDFGETWITTTITTDEGGAWDDHNWFGVSMSSDGHYQVAIEVIGEIYVSTNYGDHWAKVDVPLVTDIMWQAISSSASGQYMTAVAKGGAIFYSTDYGVTWQKVPNPSLDNRDWRCVAVSSNAQYQLAGVYGGALYSSRLV